MKILKKIKLNAISENNLENREMNALRGGENCGCGCCYANNGGSSTEANRSANYAGGYHSPGMIQIAGYMNEDGSWTYYAPGKGPWVGGC